MKKLISIALAVVAALGIVGGTQVASAAPSTTVYPIFSRPFKASHPQDCPLFAEAIPAYNDLFGPGSTLTEKEYVSAPGVCTLALVVFVP